MQMMQQQTHQQHSHPHQMDQYHHQMPQPAQPNHTLGNMLEEPQYMWQQHGTNQHQMYNMNNQHAMMDPQMHGYGYNDPMPQPQPNHMQQMAGPPPPQMQSPQNHNFQAPTPQQQEQQMLMMPPPYKSPPMNSQQQQSHQQIMSSPTINQSPHYGAPNENGTTSEDSDDSGLRGGIGNTLKRPSPEPLNESPSKAGKMNAANATVAAKKPKPQRKKKKKDPNEPQKPVSAYALFFRDTQAAIKGQNPNASFGEVSTIVASMWDALAHEHKEVYKKKTEAAKKEYLKTLAVYRATIVSKGDDVDSNASTATTKSSPSAGTVSPQQSVNQQPTQNSLPVQQSPQTPNTQPQQQPTPVKSNDAPQDQNQMPIGNHQSVNNNNPHAAPISQTQQSFIQQQQQQPQPIHQQSNMQSPPHSLPAQQQSSPYQQQQQFNPNAYKSPPSNQIDYNNMNMPMHHNLHHQQSPIHHPNQQQQMHSQIHQPNYQQQNQIAVVRPISSSAPQNNWMRSEQQMGSYDPMQQQQQPHNMLPLDPYGNHHAPPMDNHSNLVQQQQPPMHQIAQHQQHQQPHYVGHGHCEGSASQYTIQSPNQTNVFNNNNPNLNQQQAHTTQMLPQQHQMQMQSQSIQQCIRVGCNNMAVVSVDWEDEYCSSECVVKHCRNVFEDWKTVQINNAQTHQQQNFVVK